jgi:hypothetical protein
MGWKSRMGGGVRTVKLCLSVEEIYKSMMLLA